MDEAPGVEKSERNLTLRVMSVNFASIHTTSMVTSVFVFSWPPCSCVVNTDLLPRSLPSRGNATLHPAHARGGRDSRQHRRLDQECHWQDVQDRQLLQRDASVHWYRMWCCFVPYLFMSLSLSHLYLLHPLVSMNRKAVADFTFKSGAFLPKGTDVCVAMTATHHDEENYSHPEIFDGFRFAESGVLDGDSSRHQMVRL
jgi:hypothetical protein